MESFGKIGLRRETIGGAILMLLLCSALTGCGQKEQKAQNNSPASPATAAPSPNSARPGMHYSTVRVEGNGKTFDEALQSALILAVSQVNGVRASKSIDTQSLVNDFHSQSASNGEYSASENGNAHVHAVGSAQQSDNNGSSSANGSVNADANASANASGRYSSTASASGAFDSNASVVNASSSVSGVVRRFQVATTRQAQGLWYVTIVADIPVYEASVASKRLKVAVLPFRSQSRDNNSNQFEEALRSRVVDALTVSGKVAVLDRDYAQEDQGELSQLQGEDFSKDDISRLGQKLGADYIVVGTISNAAATTESVYMEAVGRRVYGATHANAEVAFRVIEAATGVVLVSGTLSGSKYSESTLDAVAQAEATDLSGKILENLFPLRIESVSDGIFYLGRGGDSMHVGDVYRVVQQGHPIVDTDTREVIGYDEKEIAQIVVTEVESKLSKARTVDGKAPQIANFSNLVARRAEVAEIQPAGTSESSVGGARIVTKPAKASRKPSHASIGGAVEGTDY